LPCPEASSVSRKLQDLTLLSCTGDHIPRVVLAGN